MAAGVTLNFEVFGETQVSRKLADYAERAMDLTSTPEVVTGVRNAFFQAEREQFTSEGAHGSGGWAALKPATLRAKASQGLDPRILHGTNRLLRSLLAPGPDASEEITEDSLFFGTGVDYAIYHQKGGKSIPAVQRVKLRAVSRDQLARGEISRDEHQSALTRINRGRSPLPKRPPVDLTESDRRRMVRVIQKALFPYQRNRRNAFNPS